MFYTNTNNIIEAPPGTEKITIKNCYTTEFLSLNKNDEGKFTSLFNVSPGLYYFCYYSENNTIIKDEEILIYPGDTGNYDYNLFNKIKTIKLLKDALLSIKGNYATVSIGGTNITYNRTELLTEIRKLERELIPYQYRLVNLLFK